jgi:isopentenyl-diphosphate Delta-isomerase
MDRYESLKEVILVDENDNPIGVETKLKAHQNGGKLHRAFSIFIFDGGGRMLLQRRARQKYHFGELWTNACCGHPDKGHALSDTAHVRLSEEFGFDTELHEMFAFLYRASHAKTGLTEHEFDHVLWGTFDGNPRPNPSEIGDWKWIDLAELTMDLESNPDRYTPWFRIAIGRVIENLPECMRRTLDLTRSF